MNHEKVLSALAECERQIRAAGATEPRCLPASSHSHIYSSLDAGEYALRHCLWLCVEAQTWTEERREKAMRWLCWVQGVMWSIMDVDIAILKQWNAPDAVVQSEEVVSVQAAIIIDNDGRILLTQTRGDANYPFTWESPGGKTIPGETELETIARELREELAITRINVRDGVVWRGTLPMRLHGIQRRVQVTMRRVSTPDMPTPKEGQGMGWFGVNALGGLPLSPANLAALPVIVNLMALERGL